MLRIIRTKEIIVFNADPITKTTLARYDGRNVCDCMFVKKAMGMINIMFQFFKKADILVKLEWVMLAFLMVLSIYLYCRSNLSVVYVDR